MYCWQATIVCADDCSYPNADHAPSAVRLDCPDEMVTPQTSRPGRGIRMERYGTCPVINSIPVRCGAPFAARSCVAIRSASSLAARRRQRTSTTREAAGPVAHRSIRPIVGRFARHTTTLRPRGWISLAVVPITIHCARRVAMRRAGRGRRITPGVAASGRDGLIHREAHQERSAAPRGGTSLQRTFGVRHRCGDLRTHPRIECRGWCVCQSLLPINDEICAHDGQHLSDRNAR
jgi:hypothetical protein